MLEVSKICTAGTCRPTVFLPPRKCTVPSWLKYGLRFGEPMRQRHVLMP